MNIDNEQYIEINALGTVVILSLIAIKSWYILERMGMTRKNDNGNCLMLNGTEYNGGSVKVLGLGDSIYLGIDEEGNKVYGTVDLLADNGFFEYKVEPYIDIDKFPEYAKYKNTKIKYEIAGICGGYHWMDGGLYGIQNIRGKILPDTIFLTNVIENVSSSIKFNNMVLDNPVFKNSHINIGNIIMCSKIRLEDSTLNVDRVQFALNKVRLWNSKMRIGEINRRIALVLDESTVIVDDNSKEYIIYKLWALDSHVEIHSVSKIYNLDGSRSEIFIGSFDEIYLEKCTNAQIIFTNPLEFGRIKFCRCMQWDDNCIFEFPNGAPIEKVAETLEYSSISSCIVHFKVLQNDYELLMSKYKDKVGIELLEILNN